MSFDLFGITQPSEPLRKERAWQGWWDETPYLLFRRGQCGSSLPHNRSAIRVVSFFLRAPTECVSRFPEERPSQVKFRPYHHVCQAPTQPPARSSSDPNTMYVRLRANHHISQVPILPPCMSGSDPTTIEVKFRPYHHVDY
ncbi:hypothetical protein RRG08_016201 [Elysia crispata]|uniref:Uncharacterized protein n=1 Tax=Elysia crispata TaxID=231223 RepID=A0AAE0ZR51_9GAST|nr:hypothetical protein RRG08_016201 [Elysia crispata]